MNVYKIRLGTGIRTAKGSDIKEAFESLGYEMNNYTQKGDSIEGSITIGSLTRGHETTYNYSLYNNN